MEYEVPTKTSKNLKNFYLDPNNYRFVDNKDYKKINDEEVLDVKIQQRTRNFISGKNREGVRDLLDSFKANGFLEVDVIQLKDLGDNNYLVLEGNRRVTALKVLQEEYDAGLDIGKLNPSIFKSVPSFIHNNEDDATHRIIMGLKHISGNKKWPAINQAQLIYDYLAPHWKDGTYGEEEVKLCESLGITKVKLRTSQRAYHLILQYKDSDYGDQFKSDMYYTFSEITKRPSIKKWIEWDNNSYCAKNEENILRLFSWLSIRVENNEVEDEEIDDSTKREAIITKYREIQELAKFIDNEEALEVMEEENDVIKGSIASGSKEQESYEKSIKGLDNSIANLNRLKDLLSLEDKEKLKNINQTFKKLLPKKSSLDIENENVSVCFSKGKIQHFDSLFIEQYKIFKDFKIDKLNRINIFAGFNNTGKTTLLEAIYLLTKQNNIEAYFKYVRLKNKLPQLNIDYMKEYFKKDIKISGKFNEIDTSIHIKRFFASDIDKKDDYSASYEAISMIDGDEINNTIHTFEVNSLIRYVDRVELLCNSIFKSPYFYNKNEMVETYSKSLKSGEIDEIITFLQKYIDSNIMGISHDGIDTFIVNHKIPTNSPELTSYGEGLQRIFEIALSFANCRNGVLLIDELETAIHYSLLVDFTKFIQELAVKFNVQVFITSHSKECIDAFVNNGVHNEDISAYFLKNKDNQITTKYVGGDRLKYLVENISLDIRGDKNE
ncbi:MAG: AAA family ATPase [Sulfurovum sp.]